MKMPRSAGVKELLIVVKVETVEVRALPAGSLRDPKHLPSPNLERLAGARLQREFRQYFSLR